jgi:hypothetical protein
MRADHVGTKQWFGFDRQGDSLRLTGADFLPDYNTHRPRQIDFESEIPSHTPYSMPEILFGTLPARVGILAACRRVAQVTWARTSVHLGRR